MRTLESHHPLLRHGVIAAALVAFILLLVF
jgi:hypothetical protein